MAQRKNQRQTVAGKFLFRSTEGIEQHLDSLLTDIAVAVQSSTEPEWHRLQTPILRLKQRVINIGGKLERRTEHGSAKGQKR